MHAFTDLHTNKPNPHNPTPACAVSARQGPPSTARETHTSATTPKSQPCPRWGTRTHRLVWHTHTHTHTHNTTHKHTNILAPTKNPTQAYAVSARQVPPRPRLRPSTLRETHTSATTPRSQPCLPWGTRTRRLLRACTLPVPGHPPAPQVSWGVCLGSLGEEEGRAQQRRGKRARDRSPAFCMRVFIVSPTYLAGTLLSGPEVVLLAHPKHLKAAVWDA